MNGKLNGVIAATTPIGSRTIALPAIPAAWPAGSPLSTQGNECSEIAALERNMPMEPAACTKSVRKPVDPVSATISSSRSPDRDSRISAILTSAAARWAGFIHGQGPLSNARRAAVIAWTAVFTDPLGTDQNDSPVPGTMQQ